MISAVAWVRKGIASQKPQIVQYTKEELEELGLQAQQELELAQKDYQENENNTETNEESIDDLIENGINEDEQKSSEFDDLAEFDMENYDNDEENVSDIDLLDQEQTGLSMFSNATSLLHINRGNGEEEEDPYIELDDGDNQSEIEELEIDARDNVLVVAKTEQEISNLEVYVYEGEMENLYVHHDIMLPSFPLCLEWVGHKVGKHNGEPGIGNYIAVGTFEPTIEIWNLDIVDVMLPDLVLGKQPSQKPKKKKKNQKVQSLDSHTDAIMSLSWNKNVMNILASSSADKTVRIWDLNNASCLKTYNHHSDKVQTVQWHPTQAPVMITGSYDKSVAVVDTRADENSILRFSVDSDVEGVCWDIHNENCFYTNLESGKVCYFDIRNGNNGLVYSIDAHSDSSCSSMDIHPTIKNCILTTGANDKTVKIWNTKNTENNVSLVVSRDLGVGKLFSGRFCPDSDFEISIGGDGGKLIVWDLSTNSGVTSSFNLAPKRKTKSKPITESLVLHFSIELLSLL
ncbi:hypothetical protein BB559_005513 [Furculomyces boomerangus]|uniref:Uncharacterized protein n=1 Tax=Furculomyces boomerangus TaxID=61424 RepID=A0A2T9Y8C5_9FUNG|nr:hypothetical protein BB559_005513 [Furculomyces boomerangus]